MRLWRIAPVSEARRLSLWPASSPLFQRQAVGQVRVRSGSGQGQVRVRSGSGQGQDARSFGQPRPLSRSGRIQICWHPDRTGRVCFRHGAVRALVLSGAPAAGDADERNAARRARRPKTRCSAGAKAGASAAVAQEVQAASPEPPRQRLGARPVASVSLRGIGELRRHQAGPEEAHRSRSRALPSWPLRPRAVRPLPPRCAPTAPGASVARNAAPRARHPARRQQA